MNPDIAANVEQIRQRTETACQRAGRSSDEVTLVAVSKQKSAQDVFQAIQAGITNFGENRVEEASWKIHETESYAPAPHRWHMIGHIQSRKAKDVVSLNFALIHSLHDLKLATRYNRFAEEQGSIQPVLLEINVSGEETKSGWNMAHWEQQPERRAELWHDIEALLQMPALRIEGLMTMAPWVDEPAQIRPVFQSLARLREALQNEFYQITWQHLSMGMTDDFEIAIEEGATLVRIGRAIFGERTA